MLFGNGERMSDFLSNLISRSFATQPAIRPRLPSLFESAAAENFSEIQSVSPMTTAAQTLPTVSTAPNLFSREESSAEKPIANVSVRSHIEPKPSFNNEPAAILQPPITPSPRTNDKPFIEPEPKKIVVSATSGHDRKNQAPTAKTQLYQEFSERAAFKPERQNSFSQIEPRPPAPTIHVTIGRVEVRAIQSAAPGPKSAKPAPPKLSLDDYLQKRDGGAR
jgi:hypothetical protein